MSAAGGAGGPGGGGGECACCRPDYPSTANKSGVIGSKDDRSASAVYRKKSSGDQSLMSITIDENDGDEDDDDDDDVDAETCPLNPEDAKTTSEHGTSTADRPSMTGASGSYGYGRQSTVTGQGLVRNARPSLKRNNTDDSEIERRMAKIFHEINYSLTDSLEETKYQSQEGVTQAEAETQTMSEQEVESLLRDGGSDATTSRNLQSSASDTTTKANQTMEDSTSQRGKPKREADGHGERERFGGASVGLLSPEAARNLDLTGDHAKPTNDKRSKLYSLTAAIFPSRNRKSPQSPTKTGSDKKPNKPHSVLLMLGLTD